MVYSTKQRKRKYSPLPAHFNRRLASRVQVGQFQGRLLLNRRFQGPSLQRFACTVRNQKREISVRIPCQAVMFDVQMQQVDLLVKGSRPSSAARLDRPSPAVARTGAIPTPAVPHRGYHGWLPQSTIIGLVDPAQPFIAASPTSVLPLHHA